jgi:putative transposase
MTEYRRLRLPGATYFFTLCLERRGATTLVDQIDALRFAYARTVQELPVTCHAMIILPDHLHAVMTEPEGGVFYSERWRRIKSRFSHAIAVPGAMRPSLEVKRERGIWQRRFWEHALRSEDDFRAALQYCEQDAVKHGLVAQSELWPYSSFAKRRMGNIAHPTSDQKVRELLG